ncbi:PhnD/SsuA/transferrin family substrate-binding protein [Shewanella sp. JM162201]|uniref:PhnD/SsuA/transferrin family substrate-binding protein n=2 Tax=Shewanella jiangmenensis TaxID=2837387 RepID=A0ABS5UY35_9GAMM|nr:PhnD/SsuA/transferrin family substrate-binding protein [Shewanella jiangmenensis]
MTHPGKARFGITPLAVTDFGLSAARFSQIDLRRFILAALLLLAFGAVAGPQSIDAESSSDAEVSSDAEGSNVKLASIKEAENGAAANAPVLVFGIVPQQSASTLARLWAPLMARLSADTGVALKFATAPDIPEFEARLARGEYDLAYMNPFHYVVFHQDVGYEALVREADKKLKGILVVQKDSPIKSIEEVAGQSIALPAPAAFAASVLPRAVLHQLNIEAQYAYVGSHDSVYLGVSRGLFPVGGGVMRTFDSQTDAIKASLRILWQTPGYTPHAFAVHPRVDKDTRAKLLAAFVALGDDDNGRALLKSLAMEPLAGASDSDWDDIRALKLGALPSLGSSGK